jgi:formylglycine-generating enzyme required for sulfatase activity
MSCRFLAASLGLLLAAGALALDAPQLAAPSVVVVGDSLLVQLSWEPVAGASAYRVLGRVAWSAPAQPLALVETPGLALMRPAPLGLFEVLAVSSGPETVLVPAGTFLMGSGAIDNLVHEVTLTRDFWLARTETTNAEYIDALNWAWEAGLLAIDHDLNTASDWVEWDGTPLLPVARDATDDLEIRYDAELDRFVLHAATQNTNTWGPGFAYPEGYDPAEHPVKFVTWMGAAAYCDWLSLQAGLTPLYNNEYYHDPTVHNPYEAQGWRLPTEAEWERAARWDDQRLYPWGGEAPDCERVNYRFPSHCVGWSTPVGAHPAGTSALGFQDLGGNVQEWCNDYGEVFNSEDPVTDPTGPSYTSGRAVRNGGWSALSPAHMRCSWRDRYWPLYSINFVGFRICRTVQ